MTQQGPTHSNVPEPSQPPAGPSPSKIQHVRPGFGSPPGPPAAPRPGGDEPLAVVARPSGSDASGPDSGPGSRIRAIEGKVRHEASWSRTPNTTGTGAIHVKTFHCKLTEDALRFMDQNINEWLDAHPQYEVKFVNSSIGTFTGKLKEPALICQVWV